MKQGKRLTVAQKKHLEGMGLQPESWLICKNVKGVWTLEHKQSFELKEVEGLK